MSHVTCDGSFGDKSFNKLMIIKSTQKYKTQTIPALTNGTCRTPRTLDQSQAYSEYKHSLTFHIRRYVVIATQPVHQLQIHSVVHNWRTLPKLHPVHAVVWECSKEHTDTRIQTAVTNIHFASATPHVKCNLDSYLSPK